ncbi:protein Wnt-2-like [Manduca sexta]|nr:protein Wnt-2-like [Manduca sexta]
MPMATREAAFTYAITSAGVTHALSMACARGELPACGCTANRRRVVNAVEQFQWGGCGSGAFGARVARRFLDARELERDARALMNLHNNRVGRKVSEVLRTAPALVYTHFFIKRCRLYICEWHAKLKIISVISYSIEYRKMLNCKM